LASSQTLAAVAGNSGLDFAAPYADLYAASAYIGLRRFAVATRLLSAIERATHPGQRGFLFDNLRSQRARLYASVNDLERALDALSLDPVRDASKASRGEVIGWRALLTATAGESDRAAVIAENARSISRDRGTTALSNAADAIVALNNGHYEVAASCLQTTIDTQVWDPVVIAVRAAPHVGTFIAEQTQWRQWLQLLLAASKDASLAASLGLRIPRAAKSRAALSPRESEVHELLAQGLTNVEIAKLLYISVSTTKVHVKHIYEKLGVRSRLEAARALRGDV
jgi:DNA-binding NarL/FixJ family response regulator